MVLDTPTLLNIESYIEKAKVDTPGCLMAAEANELFLTARIDKSKGDQIWDLVDPEKRGFLGRASFVVLLYLIKTAKNGVYFESLPVDCEEFIINYPAEKRNQKEIDFEIRKNDKKEFENAFLKLTNLVQQISGQQTNQEKSNNSLLEKFRIQVN